MSGNYYRALGVTAWLGRALLPEDDQPGAPAVAVISYGFWQQRWLAWRWPRHLCRPKLSYAEIESRFAATIGDGLWRDGVLVRDLLAKIEVKDLEFVLEFVERNSTGAVRRHLQQQLLEHWTALDPAAAAAWCAKLPDGPNQQEMRRLVANLWSETDPEAALRLAPTPDVFHRLALKTSDAAAVHATQPPPGDDRTAAIYATARTWFEKEPIQAIKWVGSLENAGDCIAGLIAVVGQLEPSDLSGMATYISNLANNTAAAVLIQDFAAKWADGDPRAAAAWAKTLPAGSSARENAIRVISYLWTREDSRAASTWIAELRSQK